MSDPQAGAKPFRFLALEEEQRNTVRHITGEAAVVQNTVFLELAVWSSHE